MKGRSRNWRALLASLLLLCVGPSCSSDSPAPSQPGGPSDPPSVASVTIIGSATDPLLKGTSHTLLVSLQDSAGGSLTGRTVSWTSSNTAVAAVNVDGLVTSVGAGTVVITAECEGKTAGATLEFWEGKSFPVVGGVYVSDDVSFRLNVATGTVAWGDSLLLLVSPVSAPPNTPGMLPGTTFELRAKPTSFLKPVQLDIFYDPATLPQGVTFATLAMHELRNGSWRIVPQTFPSISEPAVSGALLEPGTFAIVNSPVDRIVISGAPSDNRILVGQDILLVAHLYDPANNDLLTRYPTWTSSDSDVAEVLVNGRVFGRAPGTAVISASLEGVTGSATIIVESPPLAHHP